MDRSLGACRRANRVVLILRLFLFFVNLAPDFSIPSDTRFHHDIDHEQRDSGLDRMIGDVQHASRTDDKIGYLSVQKPVHPVSDGAADEKPEAAIEEDALHSSLIPQI